MKRLCSSGTHIVTKSKYTSDEYRRAVKVHKRAMLVATSFLNSRLSPVDWVKENTTGKS